MTEITKIDLEKIAAIFLDEKVVKFPIKFNETEGWVDMQVPVIPKTNTSVSLENPDIDQFYWQTVRKEGKVRILYADQDPTKVQ